jgi:ribosomal protein S18 acetylase RimI-like enzyme
MADRTSIRLTPIPIELNNAIFHAICAWPFADNFVGRVLREDIPRRARFNGCRVWVYRDPDNEIVGFGTIEVCDDYRRLSQNRPHPYIPLLAVNPRKEKRGHGTSIIKHLVGQAALLACQPTNACHDILFLDVYLSSTSAIRLYEKCGFVNLSDKPLHDPIENKPYIVMAKRVSIGAF